ncbi:hypothetical protein [Sporohalobacter salinus]|uniref:hypothetical protein n=1 Tax=Sporohalobacter salinus TaxID=1494606 RepID=UPI001960F523|nr:hypothetical protein [Sporohalobacter salinus]MBM7625127.1 ferredoxin-fold anticodon binding domain-containing protein [Sporohalobacter salinus]
MAEVIGIAEKLPENPQYFKQFDIGETVTIPEQKPDMEELVSVMIEPEVISMKVIDTPCIKSYEGQLLSGKKLALELKLNQKITYIADDAEQSVHAAHFENILRSVFVVIPQEVDGTAVEKFVNFDRVCVNPFIENIFAEQQDERTVFKNVTLLIDVSFQTCEE